MVIDDYDGGLQSLDINSPNYDPLQIGQGLISHGSFVMHGAAKTDAGTLAVEPGIGDTTLTFDFAPSNWKVGDKIVIAGTEQGANGFEERIVSAVNGVVVTFDSALTKTTIRPRITVPAYSSRCM